MKILILFSGLAAMSWSVIWQVQSSLALGVSSWGTALTLAVTMGGLCVGSLLCGRVLRRFQFVQPARFYGVLEIIIGLSGLFILPAFVLVESLDSAIYRVSATLSPLIHVLGMSAVIGIATICMGATVPVFGLMAKHFKHSIALFYGLNTLGAALGSLIAAFIFIPLFGISGSIVAIALINILVGIFAMRFTTRVPVKAEEQNVSSTRKLAFHDVFVVSLSGFAILALEVAWFRSLTAAFLSTTAAFSIMVSSVLLSLGLASAVVPYIKKRGVPLAGILCAAGVSILLVTPIIERFDMFTNAAKDNPFSLFLSWFVLTFYTTGVPIFLLGCCLPWVLDDQGDVRSWSVLYGLNSVASVAGSIAAAWIFLPMFGFAKTAWIIGLIIAGTGCLTFLRHRSLKTASVFGSFGILALFIAVVFESGVGTDRVQFRSGVDADEIKIVKSYDGPQSTVSVVEFKEGLERSLIIDGFMTTSQAGAEGLVYYGEYMQWMGHLPMLYHVDANRALVICFGTGQTANAVLKESPKELDIVDINKDVFKLAPYFSSNENVLEDEKVNAIVMDGRAFLRRTAHTYDVITLEPMPPTFSGVNSLYSHEFYDLAKQRLSEDGIIAQWLPFHILSTYLSASITKTFYDVFPNSVLWMDPQSRTGILIGSNEEGVDLTQSLFAHAHPDVQRPFSLSDVQGAFFFDTEQLKVYGELGDIISDDNQLLAYGISNVVFHGEIIKIGEETDQFLNDFKDQL